MPGSPIRQAACIQPILGNVPNSASCTDGVFLSPSYDPVTRVVTFRQSAGNAGSPLLPPDPYELTIYSAPDATSSGLLSFDGIPLSETFQLDLAVLPYTKLPPYDPPLSGDRYCTAPGPMWPSARPVSGIFAGCAFGGCHGVSPDPTSGLLGQPAEGLQLGTPADLLATAVNHVAHETQTGENASSPDPTGTGLRFGRAMPILSHDVYGGEPGNSYLVYKLLAFPGLPLQNPFPPDPNDPSAPAPEIVRLQDELVVGMPMPPLAGPPGVQLLPGEPEWLSAWILQGMPMPICNGP